MDTNTVFSEYFLDQIGIKVDGATEATLVDCVGSLKEEMEMKTITKKCRGRVKKSRTKPDSGTVTVTAHMPYALLLDIYSEEEFASGVYGYGTDSLHKDCVLTAKVKDEDDNVQYRAYPCAVATAVSVEIDDDNEEVPMVELAFDVTADDNEIIRYKALADEIDTTVADDWMSNWTTDLIAATV
ncbi:MAG: hypothetical protein LUD78_08150 [Clostridiales bacterium]|nr:hypothetical protein [Clostridiales bacterium]